MKLRLANGLLLAVLLAALAGLLWTPHDPVAQEFRENALANPNATHWLGIDALGRDLFSRLWAGLGHTVSMGLGALGITAGVATLVLLAEQTGPRPLRHAVRQLIGLWVAVPVVLLSLVLLVFLYPAPTTLVLAAGLGNVPLAYRQLRILWLEQKNAPYVQASLVLGGGWGHIWRHTLLPNMADDFLALAKLVFAIGVLELSGLAFLGLIGNPDFPELGAILKSNQAYIFRAPLQVIWPGLLLSGLLLLVHLSRRD